VLIVVVVVLRHRGDSVGYAIGRKWGRRLLGTGCSASARRLLDAVLDQLNRRGALAVFVARFTAFLRAVVPGLAGMSSMPYRIFLPANAAGGLIWGTAYCLLGYFVGHAYTKVEHARASRPTCCSASSSWSSSSSSSAAGDAGSGPRRRRPIG
jgi:membrane-associated protein